EAAPPREVEDLDVPREAIDPRLAEEVARDLAPEELEAALRVPDPGDREELDQPIARAAQEHAVERLALADQGLLKRARAGRDRVRRKRSGQLVVLREWGRQVDVRHEEGVAGRREDAGLDRRPLSAVLGIGQDLEREALGLRANAGAAHGVVGRSVVD